MEVRGDPLATKELPTTTTRKLEAPQTTTKVVHRRREEAVELTLLPTLQLHNCSRSNHLHNNHIESCMIPLRKRSLFTRKRNLNTRHSKTQLEAETQGSRVEDMVTMRIPITKNNLAEGAVVTNTKGEAAEANTLIEAGTTVATTTISTSSPIATMLLLIISNLLKEKAEAAAEEVLFTSLSILRSFIRSRKVPRHKEGAGITNSTIKVVTRLIITKAISTIITSSKCRLLLHT